jgi:hypothetical protein
VPTPPAFGPAIAPYSGNNRTFISGLVNSVPVITPPVSYSSDPNSNFYKMVKEVYDISQNLTTEETNIAKTWADVPGGYNSSVHYLNIVTQFVVNYKLTLDDAAVLYAKTGIASSDAGTFIFRLKYQYNLVRPITYIRNVLKQSAWNTVVPTPAHPEYPSAHAVTGQAIVEVLKNRFGNKTQFVDRTNEALYGTRSFSTLDAIAQEAAWSRVLAGIHYKNTADVSIPMGVKVGEMVNRLKFKD